MRIMSSADPGRLARLAYTYLHIVLIAGIIVSAVGDELLLSHPLGHAEPSTIAVLLGGPALYLIGNILFKRATASRMVLSHFAGLGLLALLLIGSAAMPPLLLGAASSLVLVIVAAWETWSLQLQPAVDKVVIPRPPHELNSPLITSRHWPKAVRSAMSGTPALWGRTSVPPEATTAISIIRLSQRSWSSTSQSGRSQSSANGRQARKAVARA